MTSKFLLTLDCAAGSLGISPASNVITSLELLEFDETSAILLLKLIDVIEENVNNNKRNNFFMKNKQTEGIQ